MKFIYKFQRYINSWFIKVRSSFEPVQIYVNNFSSLTKGQSATMSFSFYLPHIHLQCNCLLTHINPKIFSKVFLYSVAQMNMTGKKISDDQELSSNKKLCTEEKIKEAAEINKVKKVKTRKFALLLSYIGDNYHGMQKNDGFRTIQGELLQALHKANIIKAEEVNEPYLIQFQITARTDKGVSAAKQVVSLQMAENYCIKTINEYLPEDIRLLSVRRVTKGFFCHKVCTARTYSYTLPTFALAPELHTEYPENYRINEEEIQKVNKMLLLYIGTHNFHNFTAKKNFCDGSAKRYIMSFKAGKPFLQGEEFITLTVKGQSFMLHQIRKIVGHLIGTLKGLTPPNMQSDVWTEKKFRIPKAPGLGLMLENIHFDWYNKKFVSDGIHESLAWEDFDSEVQSFKNKILSHIIKKELEEKSMFNWILYLRERSFEVNMEPKDPKEINSSNPDQEISSAN